MSNSSNPMYAAYSDAHPCWPLIGGALAMNAIALPGLAMNFGVIWVTARNKALHGTANCLLALCSLFEMLHQNGHLLFLFSALSGQNFLDYHLAIRVCVVSLFGLGGIAPSVTFTGVDRLLSVLFPAFPRVVKRGPYLALVVAICLCFSVRLVVDVLRNEDEFPADWMITGTIGDFLTMGRAATNYENISLALNLTTIGLYSAIGLAVKCRKKVKSNHSNPNSAENVDRRLFRSLVAIIVVNVGGYFSAFLFALFAVPLLAPVVPAVHLYFMLLGFAAILNVSAASNAPILYTTSKEYHNAFRAEFARLLAIFGVSSAQPPKKPQAAVTMSNMHDLKFGPNNWMK